MRRYRIKIGFLMLLGALAFGPLAVSASRVSDLDPAAQPLTPFPTPTPQANGQIIYIVQQGDSLYRIAGIIEMDVQELAALNGMDLNDSLRIGQELLLGEGGPELPTESAGGSPTPTGIPPTPTPIFGTGEICVLVFVDVNGNARMDEGELPLGEAQVSVVDLLGVVAGEHTTDDNPVTDDDPAGYCFDEIENGEYTVSAAVPPEYNSTMIMNIAITLNPGDINHVEFGAQRSGMEGTSPIDTGGERSTLLGTLGLVILVSAGLLGYYAWRTTRNTPTSMR